MEETEPTLAEELNWKTLYKVGGIAVYYVSAVGFEMLSISKQYFSAESMEYKQQEPWD